MRLILAGAVTALLVGCVTPDPLENEVRGSPVTLTSRDAAAVERGMREALKDPASARFGPMGASMGEDGIITVCGWVNARNSFGGYTGMQPYLGVYSRSAGLFSPATFGSDRTRAQVVQTMCQRRGISI